MTAQRIEELLADRAIWGLSEPEEVRLAEAQQSEERSDDASFEFAAAAITAACLTDSHEVGPVPPALMRRLEADGVAWCRAVGGLPVPSSSAGAADNGSSRVAPRPAAGPVAWWVALVASLLAAVLAWERIGPEPSPAEQRQALLHRGVDLRVACEPGPALAPGDRPVGDVVWKGAEQTGFLRVRGLPVNDPRRRQYQLWIVDAGRPGSAPVDGGVFDVPDGVGELVVPVRPPLRVRQAAGFVVTEEEAGGVVVSRQDRVVLKAVP